MKEYEHIIDAGLKLNEKAVVTKTLFLFYSLFMIGQANGEISSFEELNNQIIKRFGKREIGLSYDVCVFRLNGTACTLQREGCPLQTGSF